MTAPARWDDLAPRMGVGLALTVIGFGSVWLGGLALQALLVVATGLMIWELIRLLAPASGNWALQIGVVAALALALAFLVPAFFAIPLLIAPIIVALRPLGPHKALFAAYGLAIVLAAFGFSLIRETSGLAWVLWLVLVVIVTDVAGYFAGRTIGGPKFWPRVSPKKTWSGTAAGWLGALIVGFAFAGALGIGMAILWFSLLASFASQLGDIAESAIKRQVGIKDASNILPGHGGLLDRFDGMIGATLFLLLAHFVIGVSGLS